MSCTCMYSTLVTAYGTDMLMVLVYFIQETTACVLYVTSVYEHCLSGLAVIVAFAAPVLKLAWLLAKGWVLCSIS